jgi:hypothetical protein
MHLLAQAADGVTVSEYGHDLRYVVVLGAFVLLAIVAGMVWLRRV